MMRKPAILLILFLCVQIGAAQWIRQASGTLAWLRDIQFTDKNNGWIVGSDGTVLRTRDGGDHWIASKKFTTDTILRIHFTDPASGWMLCERNVYSRGRSATSYLMRTTDAGVTWKQVEFTDAGRERVTTLMFSADGGATAFGEGGFFYTLQPDGSSWKRSSSATKYLLLSGSFTTGGAGTIVGGGGTIMFTRDNGFSWEEASVVGPRPSRLNSVFFLSDGLGWAVGGSGAIYKTTGGGKSWYPQPSGVGYDLMDVFFANARLGWAAGENGTVIRTADGGASWTAEQTGTNHKLERIAFNGSRGWAVGFGGTILSRSESPVTNARPQLINQ